MFSAKNATLLLGAVLAIVGVLGFLMESPLLGYFEVDTTHNVVHLASGLIGLWCAMSGPSASKMFLVVFGVVYALVAVLGFTMASPLLGILHVNAADNWLHALIAVYSLYFGSTAKA